MEQANLSPNNKEVHIIRNRGRAINVLAAKCSNLSCKSLPAGLSAQLKVIHGDGLVSLSSQNDETLRVDHIEGLECGINDSAPCYDTCRHTRFFLEGEDNGPSLL